MFRRAVWLGASVALAAYVLLFSAWQVTHGFVAYYAASRLLVTGQFGPQVYDDAWFEAYVQQVTGSAVREIFGPNPPTMALMATPFAPLDHSTARLLWLMASLVCLLLAARSLIRFAQGEGLVVPVVLVALVLLNPPVFANLRTGQAYLFVFALLTGTTLSLLRGRDTIAGVLLGLALALKTSGVAVLVLLIARRRWRPVLAATLVSAAAALIVAMLSGLQPWVTYPSYVREFVARPSGSVTAYQTTLGLFRHLCVADPAWNPVPAASCAPMAAAAPALLLAGAVLITIVASAGAPARLWLAAGVCLSELTLPVAAEQHFVSLAIPLVLAMPERLPLLVVAALLLIPLDVTAQQFTSGWLALAAYPRLYAAWLLWGVTVFAMRRAARRGTATAFV